MERKLLDILACPLCKGPLVYQAQAQELHCRACRLAYPIVDDIPMLREEDGRHLSLEEWDQDKR
jgi:uncharacterized protein